MELLFFDAIFSFKDFYVIVFSPTFNSIGENSFNHFCMCFGNTSPFLEYSSLTLKKVTCFDVATPNYFIESQQKHFCDLESTNYNLTLSEYITSRHMTHTHAFQVATC